MASFAACVAATNSASAVDSVARERAGEFGSIGIPATGEEGERSLQRRSEEAGEILVVLSSSFEFEFLIHQPDDSMSCRVTHKTTLNKVK